MPPSGLTILELSELLCEALRLAKPNPPIAEDELLFGGRLPLDSVDSLQWAAAIEQRFSIELTNEELFDGALLTLGQLARLLQARTLPDTKTERFPSDSA